MSFAGFKFSISQIKSNEQNGIQKLGIEIIEFLLMNKWNMIKEISTYVWTPAVDSK